MKINVAQLLMESVGQVRNYTIDETAEGGFPVKGGVKLLRTNRGILVTASLDTGVTSTCSRCLDEFEYPMSLAIEEEYFPTTSVQNGAPLPLPEDSAVFTIGEDHILDLGEVVRQQMVLAQPMKPICKEDCAGLCPQCGCNLNYSSCDCSPASPDSPFSKLQGLFAGGGERGGRERER